MMAILMTLGAALSVVLAASSPPVEVKQFDLTPVGIGSIITILTGLATFIILVKKDKKEEVESMRTYQKDISTQMQADIVKLRKNAEKYMILRKIIIEEPHVPHVQLLQKMEDEYRLINPD